MTSNVSLRFRHPGSDFKGLADLLGFPSVRIWLAGHPRTTPKGTPLDGIYEGSYCALEIVGEGSISEAIDRVDRALEAVPVSQLLNDKELEKSLYCTIIKDGEIVPFRSLAKLVKWGIQLEIDGPEFSERMDRALPRS